jgi:hypothetical protein
MNRRIGASQNFWVGVDKRSGFRSDVWVPAKITAAFHQKFDGFFPHDRRLVAGKR